MKMIDKAMENFYKHYCPYEYGLEEKPPKWCNIDIETCRKCWNREVKENVYNKKTIRKYKTSGRV